MVDFTANTKFFLTPITAEDGIQRIIAVTELERTESTLVKKLDVYSLSGDPIQEGVSIFGGIL